MIGNDQVRFGPGVAEKGPAQQAGTSPAAYRYRTHTKRHANTHLNYFFAAP
jgi:hypothetical protein